MLTDPDQTNPNEFELFYEMLMQNAPSGYIPHFFKCASGGKDPYLPSGSWSDTKARLSFEEALKWLQNGGNIGIAGMENDCLVNIDIDDETITDYTKCKQTLTCRSGGRQGVHLYYFEPV